MLLDNTIIIYAIQPQNKAIVHDLRIATRNPEDFWWIPDINMIDPVAVVSDRSCANLATFGHSASQFDRGEFSNSAFT